MIVEGSIPFICSNSAKIYNPCRLIMVGCIFAEYFVFRRLAMFQWLKRLFGFKQKRKRNRKRLEKRLRGPYPVTYRG